MMFTEPTVSEHTLAKVVHRPPRRRPPSHSSRPIWLVLLVTLSVAGFCFWKAERVQSVQAATVPISQIRLGDRVPGQNPDGDVEDAPVLAELWRAVSIEATLQDGSRLELDLLRPESWVRAHGLAVGADVPVEFGETHTQSGTGKVKRINPCPPLRAGPGKIVTGLFRHATPEIFTVSTADGERLNATAEHPFWSQDRQAFVPAKELQPGERLRHLTGGTSVVSVHSRPASETVYNLEVHGSHVFHVGQSGLLVHNCGKTTVIGRMDDLKQFDDLEHVDTWRKPGRIPGPNDDPVSWPENKAWLNERIARGDRFVIATDPSILPPRIGGRIPGVGNGYFTRLEYDYLTRMGIDVGLWPWVQP